jgi:hypothetical protein
MKVGRRGADGTDGADGTGGDRGNQRDFPVYARGSFMRDGAVGLGVPPAPS